MTPSHLIFYLSGTLVARVLIWDLLSKSQKAAWVAALETVDVLRIIILPTQGPY